MIRYLSLAEEIDLLDEPELAELLVAYRAAKARWKEMIRAIAFGAALACLPCFAGELIDRAGLNPFAAPVAVVGRR